MIVLAPPPIQAEGARVALVLQSAGFPVIAEPISWAPRAEFDARVKAGSDAYETENGPVLANDLPLDTRILAITHEYLHQLHAHGGYESYDRHQWAIEEAVTQSNAVPAWRIYFARFPITVRAGRATLTFRPNFNRYGNVAGVHYMCHLAHVATGARRCTDRSSRVFLRGLQLADYPTRDAIIAGVE